MGKTVDNTIFEVSHPEVWSLALRLCADRLKFTIHSDSDDNSLMFGELPFADTSCCYASCIEAAVYELNSNGIIPVIGIPDAVVTTTIETTTETPKEE